MTDRDATNSNRTPAAESDAAPQARPPETDDRQAGASVGSDARLQASAGKPEGIAADYTKLLKEFSRPRGIAADHIKWLKEFSRPEGIAADYTKLLKEFSRPRGIAADHIKLLKEFSRPEGIATDYTKLLKEFSRPEGIAADYTKLLKEFSRPGGIAADYTKLFKEFSLPGGIAADYTKLLKEFRRPEGIAADYTKLLDGLSRPTSFEMLLPSWRMTSGIVLAGGTSLNLAHDLLSVLYRPRSETVAFEAVVQAAEIADAPDELVGRLLELIRSQADALVDFLRRATGRVERAAASHLLVLLLTIGALFLQYHYGAEQTELARKQTELAREQTQLARAANSADSAANRELLEQLARLGSEIDALRAAEKPDPAVRTVARTAPLRAAPSVSGTKLRQIWPDEIVQIKEYQGSWALVEVFDYKAESVATGWIARSVLRVP